MAAEDRRSFRWGGSFAPRTGWAAGPFRSRWTLDRGGAARNRVSPWRFPEPLPSPPSIKCTGLREPTGGNFRREQRQHTKPSPAEAVDSCFFVWFSLRPEATFRLLLGPMGFVPDAPPSSTLWRFPTGLSLQGRSPHARLRGRLAHSTRPRPGIAMAFGVSAPAVATNSPRPSCRMPSYGAVVFVGTRVPLQNLIDSLEGGESIEDFLDGFPSVKREQVLAVIEAGKLAMMETV
jgi:uncharacterized protein (DUF433 family)